MRIVLFCKRRYTNNDLFANRFGRLFHLPAYWSASVDVRTVCLDYRRHRDEDLAYGNAIFRSLGAKWLPFFLPFLLKRIFREVADFGPDIIIGSSDIIYGILANRLSRIFGICSVFDVYDDYREFAVDRYSGLHFLFPRVCRDADGVLVASPALHDIVTPFNPNIHVTRNGYQPEWFHSGDQASARESLGLSNSWKLIVYAGSADARFDAECVRRAMTRSHARDRNIRLALAGAGTASLYPDAAWAISLGRLDQGDVARLIQASDACIAPYRATPLAQTCNPCKLAEYLACEKPVIAADVSDLCGYQRNGVFVYAPGDATALEQRIDTVLSNAPTARAVTELTWQHIADDALHFLTSTLSRSSKHRQ